MPEQQDTDGDNGVATIEDVLVSILDDEPDPGEVVAVWSNIRVRRRDTDRPLYEVHIDGQLRDTFDVNKATSTTNLNNHLLSLVPKTDSDDEDEEDNKDSDLSNGLGVH